MIVDDEKREGERDEVESRGELRRKSWKLANCCRLLLILLSFHFDTIQWNAEIGIAVKTVQTFTTHDSKYKWAYSIFQVMNAKSESILNALYLKEEQEQNEKKKQKNYEEFDRDAMFIRPKIVKEGSTCVIFRILFFSGLSHSYYFWMARNTK